METLATWSDMMHLVALKFNKKQTKTREAEPFYIYSTTANASSMRALWTT